MAGGNVEMMVSVVPGTMTGFASLNAGLASINNAFLNMTQAISDNFGLVDTAMITTGVVIAQVAADAASAFGDFEQSMKIVQLVSGQTADEISMLGQKANEFAVQYRVDIDQITEGLQTLGRAGLNSATEQTEVLQNGLSTAKLEGRQLNDVLQELIQNTALLGGNLKSDDFGEQSQYVNDLLVATSMTAPITTHDVSETLKYSGGIAAAAGANIETDQGKALLEDYMATIAAFAQKGVTGSIAGTALRAFLNKPATQDSSVLEGLATIHLKPEYLWEDDQETMKPISEQIALIQAQMDKLDISKMDRLQIWSKIVGGKMGQQMMKLESDDIKGLVKDIQDAESAESLANKSMQTFNMNVNELSQKGAAAFRDFGSKIVFFLNPALEFLNKITDILSNPIAGSAFFIGFLAFMNQVLQRIRAVFGAFRQGIANIWRDYASGDRSSIRDYRGVGLSSGGYNSASAINLRSAETPENFVKAWRNQYLIRPWEDFQSGKISSDQFGAIAATQKWNKNNTFLSEYFNKEIAQRDVIRSLAYSNKLTPKQLQDLQVMNQTQFDKTHGKDIGEAYVRHTMLANKDAAATEQNTAAQNAHASASKSSAQAQQESDAQKNQQEAAADAENLKQNQEANAQKNQQEVQASEQIITTMKNTASTVVAEWNSMCASLTTGLRNVMTDAKARPTTPLYLPHNGMPGSPFGYHNLLNNMEKIEATMYGSGMGFQLINGVAIDNAKRLDPFINGIPKGADEGAVNLITGNIARNVDKKVTPFFNAMPNVNQIESYMSGLKTVPPTGPNPLYLLPAGSTGVINGAPAPGSAMSQYVSQKESMKEASRAAREAKANTVRMSEHLGSAALVSQNLANDFRTEAKNMVAARKQGKALSEAVVKPGTTTGFTEISGHQAMQNMHQVTSQGIATGFNSVIGKYGNLYSSVIAQNRQVGNEIIAQNKDLFNRVLQQKPMGNNVMPAVGMGSAGTTQQIKDKAVGAWGSMIAYWGKSREGRMIDFLRGNPQQFSGFSKGIRGAANGLLNLSDIIGGPVMAAMMLIPMIINYIQGLYQAYAKDLQEAKNRLEEAYTALGTAEDNLRNSFKDMYPDLDESGLEDLMMDTYAGMKDAMINAYNNGFSEWMKKVSPETETLPEYEYDEETDDGSMKEKEDERTEEEKNTEAINENTRAVYAAVAEINTAMDQFVAKANDDWWGIDGKLTQVSDNMYKPGIEVLGIGKGAFHDTSSWTDDMTWKMTSSQKDENYPGYTELPGLLLEDFKDANGNWIKGLRTAMGDSVENFAKVIPESTNNFLKDIAQSSSRMGAANNLRLQQSMKQDKKSWQGLAKEIAKQEKKTGKSVGKDKTDNKRLEGLLNKINATTGNNFSRTQLLQAAYLQQMQDMLAVAQEAIVPIIAQNAETAAMNLLTNQHTSAGQDNTSGSTYATYEVASVIAAMVAQIAMAKAAEATYNQALANGPGEAGSDQEKLFNLAQGSKDANDFYKKASQKSYGYNTTFDALMAGDYGAALGTDGAVFNTGKVGKDTQYMDRILETYLASAKMSVYGYDAETAANYAKEEVKKGRDKGLSTADLYNTFAKNYTSPAFVNQIENAYLASDIGEADSGSGSGGGNGGGDSGKDNKDSGTKKERVDLVLCNKKEIPKLNVNLFKKAPSFTVLNKNFKLRDIKVNTQDKPKAVLSSIKNAIIDVQKRSDPKIIQDESAEYDPTAATEGKSVPSGSTSTSTD